MGNIFILSSLMTLFSYFLNKGPNIFSLNLSEYVAGPI